MSGVVVKGPEYKVPAKTSMTLDELETIEATLSVCLKDSESVLSKYGGSKNALHFITPMRTALAKIKLVIEDARSRVSAEIEVAESAK